MNISLKPELAKFVADQVKAGRFSSAAQVLEAGVSRLMLDPPARELDAEDLAAIEEGLEQANRGEVRAWAEVRQEVRAKYFGK